MIGLDTNILVRYLTQDDQPQWQVADRLMSNIADSGESCLICNVVLCELVWVLRSAYKLSRADLVTVLEKILRTSIFEFENKAAAWWAVQAMKQGNADFSDYLIGRVNVLAGCTKTVTFDAKLKATEGFQLL